MDVEKGSTALWESVWRTTKWQWARPTMMVTEWSRFSGSGGRGFGSLPARFSRTARYVPLAGRCSLPNVVALDLTAGRAHRPRTRDCPTRRHRTVRPRHRGTARDLTPHRRAARGRFTTSEANGVRCRARGSMTRCWAGRSRFRGVLAERGQFKMSYPRYGLSTATLERHRRAGREDHLGAAGAIDDVDGERVRTSRPWSVRRAGPDGQ